MKLGRMSEIVDVSEDEPPQRETIMLDRLSFNKSVSMIFLFEKLLSEDDE